MIAILTDRMNYTDGDMVLAFRRPFILVLTCLFVGAMYHEASAQQIPCPVTVNPTNVPDGSFNAINCAITATGGLVPGGTFTNQAGATLDVNGGFISLGSVGSSIDNAGTIEVSSTIGITGPMFGRYTQTIGSTKVDTMLQAFEIDFQGGTLTGTGTLEPTGGPLTNTGATMSPGASAGTLSITGDYMQGPGGTYAAEIAGLMPGAEHDVLAVAGTATLAGHLSITFINVPAVGQSFTILSAASIVGQFDEVTISGLPAGVLVNVIHSPISVIVKIVQPEPGNCVSDGNVLDVDLGALPNCAVSIRPQTINVVCQTANNIDLGNPGATVNCFFPFFGMVTDVNVGLGIVDMDESTLSWIDNLKVSLGHYGTDVTLYDGAGDTDDSAMNATFDDAGAAPPPTVGSVIGTFKPFGPGTLADFNGAEAFGYWPLNIVDGTSSGDGTDLTSYNIEITFETTGTEVAGPTADDIDTNPATVVANNVSETGIITDLVVFLDIGTSYIEELTIDLSHNGTTVRLYDGDDDGLQNTVINALFSDDAMGPPPISASAIGNFKPFGPGTLSDFDGMELAGLWELTVFDGTLPNDGTDLIEWTMYAATASECVVGGQTDLLDYDTFQGCISGPAGGLPNGACQCADFDNDNDIDLVDVGELQRTFSGS